MMVLISYDVNTEDVAGKVRLRKIAKICVDYGQRVQNSVFECLLNPSQLCLLKKKISDIMDVKKDSIRIYKLGKSYKAKIETIGVFEGYDESKALIL